jgi:hypothetical protein
VLVVVVFATVSFARSRHILRQIWQPFPAPALFIKSPCCRITSRLHPDPNRAGAGTRRLPGIGESPHLLPPLLLARSFLAIGSVCLCAASSSSPIPALLLCGSWLINPTPRRAASSALSPLQQAPMRGLRLAARGLARSLLGAAIGSRCTAARPPMSRCALRPRLPAGEPQLPYSLYAAPELCQAAVMTFSVRSEVSLAAALRPSPWQHPFSFLPHSAVDGRRNRLRACIVQPVGEDTGATYHW